MEPYKERPILADHDIDTVYKRYDATKETEFVENAFIPNFCNAIIKSAGLAPIRNLKKEDIILEYSLRIGKSADQRPDVIIFQEDKAYYFEVANGNGKWDDDHQKQIMLKTFKLSQDYSEVYTFAVALKEFDPEYLNEIQKTNGMYAIHLSFNDEGFLSNVFGVEEKKSSKSESEKFRIEFQEKWAEFIKNEMEIPYSRRNRKNGISWNYLLFGKSYTEKKYADENDPGLELFFPVKNTHLAIKLKGVMYDGSFDTSNKVPVKLNEIVPEMEILPAMGNDPKGKITFKFDYTDFSKKNIDFLKNIITNYANIMGLDNLIK